MGIIVFRLSRKVRTLSDPAQGFLLARSSRPQLAAPVDAVGRLVEDLERNLTSGPQTVFRHGQELERFKAAVEALTNWEGPMAFGKT